MYRILLILAFCSLTFSAYAGGNRNTAAVAGAVATGGAASAVAGGSGGNSFVSLPSGTAGALSNGWTCAVSNSVTLGPIGFAWTDDSEICRLAFQKREVCADNPRHPKCAELKEAIANWTPPERNTDVPSVAAE